MIKIGVVVQRYGEDVVGGAETLARDVAERLNASGFDVTVFTTTALDYISWENHFDAGESILKGVIVKRFGIDKRRNIDTFNKISERFFDKENKTNDITESDWIDAQGPFSPRLIKAIDSEQESYDMFIFFTYLYYSTVKSIEIMRKPFVLFPTAHDEPPINMGVMENVFRKPDSMFFLTKAEMDLVQKKFSPPGNMILSRTGVEIRSNIDENLFRRNYRIVSPFILYAGRIERGKGLELIFDAYNELRSKGIVDLVLMGKNLMDIPEKDGIKYVGYVSEQDKFSAFKGAICSIQPSHLESLSITTLESFAQKTPVLVNRNCEVLMEHVESSNGGIPFGNRDEFLEGFDTLYKNSRLRNSMGRKGLEYVKKYFSWDVVMEKIGKEIRDILSKRTP